MDEKSNETLVKKVTTLSGIDIKSLYATQDIAELKYDDDLGDPGDFPFTRGVYKNMYRGRQWNRRLVCGFGTSEETNERIKFLTEQGQTALNIVFDMVTHHGRDSDDPLAEGEVGKGGVAIDTVEDMETLLEGIPLDKISCSLITLPSSLILMAMYLAVAEQRGIHLSKLAGTNQNDVFTTMAGSPLMVIPPRPQMKLIVDTIEFCANHVPHWNAVSICGYHYREAGCTAVQEIAFTHAAGIAYCEAALERGLRIDDFAPRLSFFYNSHNNFFEEVCKFRAARRLWARIIKERFSPKDLRAGRMRFHTQTAGSSLMAQQPLNNIIRTTIQAMAAVMGGTQSLHTNSYDEALSLPKEEAAMVALRTQQIIAHESGVPDTIDPLAGSYFVESLTNTIEKKAAEEIARIDEMGGMLAAVEKRYIQDQIRQASYDFQSKVESKKIVIVGVNEFFVEEKELPIRLHKVDPSLEEKQKERLRRVRSKRDNEKVKRCLANLVRSIEADENLVRPTIEAVKACATIGEIMGLFKEEFGEFKML